MKRPNPIDEQYIFEKGLILSSTNLKGIITYANRKFCEIAGYSRDELKGQNHNMIRHPDMPKAIFKKMWDTLESGKDWTGVIKNLRSDGRYYWIYSHISLIISDGKPFGYTAVRRPAFVAEIEQSAPLYAEMLEKENNEKGSM